MNAQNAPSRGDLLDDILDSSLGLILLGVFVIVARIYMPNRAYFESKEFLWMFITVAAILAVIAGVGAIVYKLIRNRLRASSSRRNKNELPTMQPIREPNR